MRMRVLFGVASVLAMAGTLWGSVAPARACVIDEDAEPPDPVAESDLIVAGRVAAWRADYPSNLSELAVADIPVDVTVNVDKVLKGRGSEEVVFREPIGLVYQADYEDNPANLQWGTETDCGPVGFQSDPKGTYLVIGLTRAREDDDYFRIRAGDLVPRLVFFQGKTPSGREYEEAIHLATPHQFPFLPAAIVATLGPLTFLAGAALLWRRGESHNG